MPYAFASVEKWPWPNQLPFKTLRRNIWRSLLSSTDSLPIGLQAIRRYHVLHTVWSFMLSVRKHYLNNNWCSWKDSDIIIQYCVLTMLTHYRIWTSFTLFLLSLCQYCVLGVRITRFTKFAKTDKSRGKQYSQLLLLCIVARSPTRAILPTKPT